MYSFLKILCRLTLIGYFRKVKIEGRKNIKKKGPYIFISNHPSAFMDPVVVASMIKPTVYFLAAGEYMGKGFKYWFMHRFLNMIPVYRPSTMPGDTHKNEAIFDKCIEHLNRGRSILVFPEGASVTEKKINPLKTGVARIVRATEIANQMKANIEIIPIGLNYSDPHTFRSDLFVNIGEPLKASDYLTDSEETAVVEVKELTHQMEEALISTVLHMENFELEEMLDKVNSTYSRDLKSELGVGYDAQAKEFELNKLIINAFNYFKTSSPEDYAKMRAELDSYVSKLDKLGFNDKELRKVKTKAGLGQIIFLITGAPIFLIGFIGNIIPHQLTTMLQKSLKVKDSFKGSIIIGTGMFIFLF